MVNSRKETYELVEEHVDQPHGWRTTVLVQRLDLFLILSQYKIDSETIKKSVKDMGELKPAKLASFLLNLQSEDRRYLSNFRDKKI